MGEMSIHDQLVMMQNEARYDEDAAAGEEDPSIREYRCAVRVRACGKAINEVWRVLPTLSLTFGFQPFRCLSCAIQPRFGSLIQFGMSALRQNILQIRIAICNAMCED